MIPARGHELPAKETEARARATVVPMGIGAIVLAAGKGERMGRPKALVEWDGRPFLAHVLDTLRAAAASPIVVVLDPASAEFAEARKLAEAAGAAVVENPKPERGMLSSIRHGLSALSGATHAAILPVDHPGIRTRTLDALFLQARIAPDRIVVPTHESRRGHPGIFPAARFADLMGAPDAEGARAVLRSHASTVLEIRVDDPAVVRDVDTPEDLAGA